MAQQPQKRVVVTPPQGTTPSKVSSQPTMPPAPQPNKSNGSAAPTSTTGVGTQVEMKQMPGVTAENFTTFTPAQLIEGFGNKSNAIRGLAALGLKAGPISRHLGIRYQHARNVLQRPLKREIAAQRQAQQNS